MFIFFILSSQRRALIRRLILIPLRIFFITRIISFNLNSSIILVIYILVFIGGLLVLLVSMASLSSREQIINLPKSGVILRLLLSRLFIRKTEVQFRHNHRLIILWVENLSFYLNIILLIITTSLLIISKNTSNFKGIIRVT